MRTPGGYKHSLSRFLIYPMAPNPVQVKKFLPQRTVKVELLRVYGIMCIRPFELSPEEETEFFCITCTEEIPGSTAGFPVRGGGCISHDVNSVRHIHVQSSRPLAARRLKGCHRIVHLRTC